MTRRRVSVALFTLMAIFLAVSVNVADWNETHIYNPRWPPLSNLADLDRLFSTIKQQKGKLDVVFANAGVRPAPRDHRGTFFDKWFGVNVKGVLLTVQKALPLMPDGASIIFNGSIASQ